MSITNTWNVVAMDCYPQAEGQTDVVFTCHWTLVGTDGTHTGSVYGSVGVTYVAGSPFTPYANLTQDQVVGWVKEALGAEQVAAYEANVAAQIEAQIKPPVIQPPLPWASTTAAPAATNTHTATQAATPAAPAAA